MTSPNSYVEVLTPRAQNVTIFGNGAFKEVITLKYGQVIRVGPDPI